MDRRQFVAAGALFLAGCSGGNDSGGTPNENQSGGGTVSGGNETTTTANSTTQQTETGTEAETTTQTETETTTAQTGQALSVTSATFERISTDLGEESVVVGEVENTADSALSYAEVTAQYRNDAGDVLESSIQNLGWLSGGETWAVYAAYPGDGSDATDGGLDVTDVSVGAPPAPPQSAELLDSELESPADEYSSPTISGSAENAGDSTLDYLGVIAKYYNGDGQVLNTASSNVTNLAAGDTWQFEIDVPVLDPDAEVQEYEIQLTTI